MIEPKSGPSYADAAKGVMHTRSGIHFSLLNPRAEDVRIEDIAAGLGKVCRFTGQCNTHYSVGEHSVRVYRRVLQWSNEPRVWLAALLHDAAEAYLNDMAKPIKEAMRVLTPEGMKSPYDVLEGRVMHAISTHFDLPDDPETKALIKRADNEVYVEEVAQYMTPGLKNLGRAMTWSQATYIFAAAYHEITVFQDMRRENLVAA